MKNRNITRLAIGFLFGLLAAFPGIWIFVGELPKIAENYSSLATFVFSVGIIVYHFIMILIGIKMMEKKNEPPKRK